MQFKTLDVENNFLKIEEEFSSFDNSKIAILSVPYEHTVSYGKGAGNGPEAILNASAFVEFYDDEFEREICFDHGITTVEPLNFEGKVDKDALDLIESNVEALINSGKFVVTTGGEHTISTAPIAAHFKKYPNMSILHFDAHSDLRLEYEGNKYSHASFMARVIEFFDPKKITQVGIRAQCKEEAELIKEKGINTFFASAIRRGLHTENWQRKVAESLSEQVYITFDVDYFDPSIMPSTGTPEPDGFLYSETIKIFREMQALSKQIIGFDVVELAPIADLYHPDLTTARLIYKLLNFAFDGK